MEIYEHLTERYERQVLTFAADLRGFLTLPIEDPSTRPGAGENVGGEPKEAVETSANGH